MLTTVLLLEFAARGAKFKTELELRAENPGQAKYPDGLIQYVFEGNDQTREVVFWLEVESAEKSGRKMLMLATTLTLVERGLAPVLSDWKANCAMVAFQSGSSCEHEKPIDHKRRISVAIAKHIGASLRLHFAEVELQDTAHHLVGLQQKPAVIDPVDLKDPKLRLSTCLFHSNKPGHFELVVVDRRCEHWLLTVEAAKEGRYWCEILRDGKVKKDFIVPNLEFGLREVQNVWRNEFW